MGTNRRKNYFIKRRFQANFFIKFALLLFLEAILITSLFMFIARGTLTTAYHGTDLTVQSTNVYFLLNFVVITLVIGAAIAIAGAFVFMYLTHRIGGPLYRFEKTIEAAVTGDISQRMQLRKKDQLLDLAIRINVLLEQLDERISGIKIDVAKSLECASGSKNANETEQLLEKVKTSLEHFKTSK